MEETPSEGEVAEGGEPHGWGESDALHGRGIGTSPWNRETIRWCFPCRVLATECLYIQLSTIYLYAVES